MNSTREMLSFCFFFIHFDRRCSLLWPIQVFTKTYTTAHLYIFQKWCNSSAHHTQKHIVIEIDSPLCSFVVKQISINNLQVWLIHSLPSSFFVVTFSLHNTILISTFLRNLLWINCCYVYVFICMVYIYWRE